MIIEMSDEMWRNLTDESKDAMLDRPNVRVRLYSWVRGKRGMKKVDFRFVDVV